MPVTGRNQGKRREGAIGSIAVTALLALGCIISPAAAAPAAAGHPLEKGMLLNQRSGFINTYLTKVTANGVRIDHDSKEWYVISKAPEWKVYVVRPKDKEMAVVSHHDWCYKYQVHPLSWTSGLTKPVSVTKSTQDGMPTVTYRYGATEAFGSMLKMRSDMDRDDPTNKPNHAEVICIEYPNSDKSGPVMSRLRGLPPNRGILMRAFRRERGGQMTGALDTANIDAKAKIDPRIFDAPSDYKIVDFNPRLVQTRIAQDNTRYLLEDFMTK